MEQHPESTVVTASLHQQQMPQQKDEPESSTERAVPTSTSGDDGELDELKGIDFMYFLSFKEWGYSCFLFSIVFPYNKI